MFKPDSPSTSTPAASRRPHPPADRRPPPPADRIATAVDKGHGRRERRTLEVTATLTVRPLWKGLKRGFRLTRERTIRGHTTVEVVYGITSLSDDRGTAQALLGFAREHWGIENRLHWVRDETLGEDACRVRSGSAPQVLAALRNSVVALLAQVDADSYREALELMQLHPDDAQRLIGIAQGD